MIINVTYHFETTLILTILFVQNLILFKGKHGHITSVDNNILLNRKVI